MLIDPAAPPGARRLDMACSPCTPVQDLRAIFQDSLAGRPDNPQSIAHDRGLIMGAAARPYTMTIGGRQVEGTVHRGILNPAAGPSSAGVPWALPRTWRRRSAPRRPLSLSGGRSSAERRAACGAIAGIRCGAGGRSSPVRCCPSCATVNWTRSCAWRTTATTGAPLRYGAPISIARILSPEGCRRALYTLTNADVAPNVPSGGIKCSGTGVEFGEKGLPAYTTIKMVNAVA